MNVPTKNELQQTIAELTKQNTKLHNELTAEQQQNWLKLQPLATKILHEELNKTHPNIICNVRFEHVDAAGYWFTYEFTNDSTRQTIAIRHSQLN